MTTHEENEKRFIKQVFEEKNAIWMHDGNPEKPHAELTTGLCSNGYVDCRKVLGYPLFCKLLAKKLYDKILDNHPLLPRIDLVVGSPYSAITISYEMAAFFQAKHGFVEKDPKDQTGKRMIWKGEPIKPGQRVFQAEELISTGHTFFEVRRAMQAASPQQIHFLPFVGCIVHRPSNLSLIYDGEVKVTSLLDIEIWAAKPGECHLCKAGSKRLRPRENWAELTGKK